MAVLGIICLVIVAIFAILWLYGKISLAKKYTKTTGEIIDVRNIVPLVDKSRLLPLKNTPILNANIMEMSM